jgi:hypothetical protein
MLKSKLWKRNRFMVALWPGPLSIASLDKPQKRNKNIFLCNCFYVWVFDYDMNDAVANPNTFNSTKW